MGYTYSPDKDDWQFEGPEGPVSVKTNVRMHANNGDTCTAAAVAGIGITRQPSFMLSEHIRHGRLVQLMPQYHCGELGIYAVYPSRTHLPAKVRATIDFLVHAFENVQWELE